MDYAPKPHYQLNKMLVQQQDLAQDLLNLLHEEHLDMIDHAVLCSDMQAAKDIIAYVMGK